VSVSTHVLDAVAGAPAAGIPVRLERRAADGWSLQAERATDVNGRVGDLAGPLDAGIYRLTFDVEGYFAGHGFYPEVVVVFRITDGGRAPPRAAPAQPARLHDLPGELMGRGFEVPVVDLAGFREGAPDQRVAVAAQVDSAAREVGFLNIVGHGVPASVVDGLGGAIDAFFALPAATKNALRPALSSINRGYSGPRTEHLSHSLGVVSAPDLFEAFNVGTQARDWPGLGLDEQVYPDNLWPVLPGFRPAVEAWFAEAGRVARELTQVFAVALGLPSTYFAAFTDHSIDVLRMNCYQLPAAGVRVEVDQMGMGAHTDYGIVTVLWADAISPGLQVLDSAGGWHDVVPAPGALLVNLGDALARWTNDRWLSSIHRVLPPVDASGRAVRRRSAAYFHDGNAEAVVACLPGCSDADRPARYEPVTVADHLSAKLAGSRGGTLNASAGRERARLEPVTE